MSNHISSIALAISLTGSVTQTGPAPVDLIPHHDYYCEIPTANSVIHLGIFHSLGFLAVVIGDGRNGFIDHRDGGYLDEVSVSDEADVDTIYEMSDFPLKQQAQLQATFVKFVEEATDALGNGQCILEPSEPEKLPTP